MPGYPAGQLHMRPFCEAASDTAGTQPALHYERAQGAEHIRRLKAGRPLILAQVLAASATAASSPSTATTTTAA